MKKEQYRVKGGIEERGSREVVIYFYINCYVIVHNKQVYYMSQ